MSTSSILNNFNVTIEQANTWIYANLSNPTLIYQTALDFGLNSENLAEIIQLTEPSITARDVEGFFNVYGLDSTQLSSEEEPQEEEEMHDEPVDDYPDDFETASSIDIGEQINGSIEIRGDEDVFKVSLDSTKAYKVTISDEDNIGGANVNNDSLLRIYNSDKELVSYTAFSENFLELSEVSGDYYISVIAKGNLSTPEYQLDVQDITTVIEDESSYYIYDYLPKLTSQEMSNATVLEFSPYTPSESLSHITTGWDNEASYGTSRDYAILFDEFKVNLVEGRTYDVFSQSYFDPFILTLSDSEGFVVAIDNGSSSYGIDKISNFKAPYTGEYFINASWNQGAYYERVSVSIYEDIDTALIA